MRFNHLRRRDFIALLAARRLRAQSVHARSSRRCRLSDGSAAGRLGSQLTVRRRSPA
jgi:hypothetical protein